MSIPNDSVGDDINPAGPEQVEKRRMETMMKNQMNAEQKRLEEARGGL
jgi:hypothetical protein